MHTLIKNNKINCEKGIPCLLAIITILITPWDLQEPHAVATLKIAIALIVTASVCIILKINNKIFLSVVLTIGILEICQYNYIVSSRGTLKNDVPVEFTQVRQIKYANTRVKPFNDPYFDNKLSLYAITGDYLQQDYVPSLRQDIVSKDVQQLMLARYKKSNPKDLPEFSFENHKNKFFNVFGDYKYDSILRKELGSDTSKIRLTGNVTIAKSSGEAFAMVANQDIYTNPVITVSNPNKLLDYIKDYTVIPVYTATNTYFSANKHSFLINNFNRSTLWLIYADAYNKNWHAYLDGMEQIVYPANLAFKAIQMPPGSHTVEFIYKKPIVTYKIFFIMQSIIGFVLLSLIISYPLVTRHLNSTVKIKQLFKRI